MVRLFHPPVYMMSSLMSSRVFCVRSQGIQPLALHLSSPITVSVITSGAPSGPFT